MCSKLSRTLAVLFLIVVSLLPFFVFKSKSEQEEECTSVIVNGTASKDGKPILAKNRDSSASTNSPVYSASTTITIGTASYTTYSYTSVNGGWMGINSRGLAVTNTAISELYDGSYGYAWDNFHLNVKILQLYDSVNAVATALNQSGGIIGPYNRAVSTGLGVIDRFGNAAFFEVSGTQAYAKYIVNGFDSEANHARFFPGKASGPSGRDQYALDIMNRVYSQQGYITYQDVAQKVMRYVRDMEQGTSLFAVDGTEIARDTTVSSFVAVSGDGRYNGELNAFWGEYGNNPMVGIYLPSMVIMGNPPTSTSTIYHETLIKRNSTRDSTQHYYYPDKVRSVQAYAFSAEKYSFDKYENLLTSAGTNLDDASLKTMITNFVNDAVSYEINIYLSGTEPTIFKDGFESGGTGLWNNIVTTTGETVSAIATNTFRGSYAIEYITNGGNSVENAYLLKTYTNPFTEVYATGYFYISTGLPLIDTNDRFYFIRIQSSSTSSYQTLAIVGIRRNSGVDKWALITKSGANNTAPYYSSTRAVRPNHWYFIELHWVMSPTVGLAEAWVDGQKILAITNVNTAYYGGAVNFNFGMESGTNLQQAVTVDGDAFTISEFL